MVFVIQDYLCQRQMKNKRVQILPEILVDRTLNSVCTQTKVHVSFPAKVHIVLVQRVIQALIQVFQVQKYNCVSCFHADLDLVNVATNLDYINKYGD